MGRFVSDRAALVGRDDIGWFDVPDSTVGAPLSPRRRQTRERLIEAAEQIFTEYGVLAAGVEQICDRARFSRGAFYSNFSDLDQLCVAVIDHQADRDLGRLTERLGELPRAEGDDVTAADRLRPVLTVYRDLHDPRTTLLLTELRSFALRRPAIRPQYLATVRSNSERIFGAINDTLRELGWRFPLNDRQAAILFEGLYESTVVREMLNGGGSDRTVDELTAVLAPMLVPVA